MHHVLEAPAPTDNATAFWTGNGIPARALGLSSDARRLTWGAGVFALYRAHTEQLFDNIPTIANRVATAWAAELLGALSQKRKAAQRTPAPLRQRAIDKYAHTYGALYTRLHTFATTASAPAPPTL